MKKLIVICLSVSILLFLTSCKAKQKPYVDNNLGGSEPPPKVNISAGVQGLQTSLDSIVSEGDVAGWGTGNSGWETADKLATRAEDFRGKYLLTILQNASLGNVWAFGISGENDVFVGTIPVLADGENEVGKALSLAGERTNWDPRKFLYLYNNRVSLTWSGRAGFTINGNNSREAFESCIEYDAQYKHILQGGSKSFGLVSEYEGIQVSNMCRDNGVRFEDLNDFYSKHKDASRFSFVYEKAAKDTTRGRRGWVWGGDGYATASGRVINQDSIRFGYGKNDTSYPWRPLTAGSTGKSSTMLDIKDDSTKNNDTSAPKGKTVLSRSLTVSGSVKGAMFLTTVVGYNMRVRNYTGNDIGDIKKEQLKEVIFEFDADSFRDAGTDNWSHVSDVPIREGKAATAEIGSSGTMTHKIPFLLYTPK